LHRGNVCRLVTIEGVGRELPTAPYNATPQIWRFFAAHAHMTSPVECG
jgi:hypothetical protein